MSPPMSPLTTSSPQSHPRQRAPLARLLVTLPNSSFLVVDADASVGGKHVAAVRYEDDAEISGTEEGCISAGRG